MPHCQSRRANEPRLSIVMPILNEAALLRDSLLPLQPLREEGLEIILADGGSSDGGPTLAAPLVDTLIESARGRALQLRVGSEVARAPVLWFLHADSEVPLQAVSAILSAVDEGARWGWFDVRLSGARPALRLVEWLMNRRARLTRIATGDQGLFVTRAVYRQIGGFPDLPLMEDIALSRLLRRSAGGPRILAGPLVTSSRRWETRGIARTVFLMWWLRLRFWLGEDPARLERIYYGREG
jgi:rSAM/selenodomain-associated transferase 2